MGITTTDVKNLTYNKHPKQLEIAVGKAIYPAQYLWDDELRGFGVRVFPTGRKSFIVTYRNEANTKRFFTIGNFPDITPKQARDLAREKLHEVSKGIDPQSIREEKKKEITFAELAEQYLDYSKEHKRSYKDDRQRIRDHLLPTFGKRKLSEISLSKLQQHISKLREKLSPATVNRCIALVKHMYTMAMRWQIVAYSPALHLQPYKEPPPCDVVLSPEDCLRILAACDEEENIYAAALFKLALLTGRRIGEIRNARWEDVAYYKDDTGIERTRVTIQSTKAGEQQHVFLNDLASAVLSSLPRVLGNPYIVAGSAMGKPLQSYAKAWRRVLKTAEVPYIKPHGLRHNYVSTLVAAGEPMEIVGHLVGHKNTVTTKKYAHHRPEWLQKSTQRFGEVIDLAEARKLSRS